MRADEIRELCFAAVEANLRTPSRRGNIIDLNAASAEDVLVTADLHGHQDNFNRILERADLDRFPQRHLILQEVCHGGPTYDQYGACRSHAMLEAVVRLKVRYPERVHFLLSNHELAEQTSYPIVKDGKMLLVTFLLGLTTAYGDDAEQVHDALSAFIGSSPLGVRVGDAFICHSAPEEMEKHDFDPVIFERPLVEADLQPGGDAFRMVWGRDYRESNALAFADRVGAGLLIHGHTPCPAGFTAPNRVQLILDCIDRPAGCVLLPSQTSLTHDEICDRVELLEPSSTVA
ncbi:MAG TPA: metallophosphoesterase [Pirellulales bacterium]